MKENIHKTEAIFPENPATAASGIEDILAYALELKASDIHLDPRLDDIRVRVRIDGIMEDAGVLPKRLHAELIARLKILAGARTDLHAVPQDGRFQADVGGETCNIRISFMPAYHGENAVMRILPTRAAADFSFAKLGFTPEHVSAIDRTLRKTSGLILVVGPTGCGKTTTLHTCMSIKSREPLSVMTLEDPVEYEIAGIRQIHIRHTHGVTFAAGLRSALRQDPDVIMVGEIRDAETARVAIHTALTGHLVLSTLHTNSALETISRLADMGIDHYLLAATLKLIVAQRLVRTLCHECSGVGCEMCRGSGYAGRGVIAEACEVDPGLQGLIAEKKPLSSLLAYAGTRGFRPMADDGMEKVEWGVTTRNEIMRVLYG